MPLPASGDILSVSSKMTPINRVEIVSSSNEEEELVCIYFSKTNVQADPAVALSSSKAIYLLSPDTLGYAFISL